jgi:DNA (cytosine-5)-methyltransferase 1
MIRPQLILDISSELIVDSFAGGGGASMGIEMALGRPRRCLRSTMTLQPSRFIRPITRKPAIIAKTFSKSTLRRSRAAVLSASPGSLRIVSTSARRKAGNQSQRRFGVLHGSSLNGLPGSIRASSSLRTSKSSRIGVRCLLMGRLARNGKEIPSNASLAGWKLSVTSWSGNSCGPAIMARRQFESVLYLVARCDDRPIVWPRPTHGDPSDPSFRTSRLKRWRTASECIDWSVPCYSIFLTKAEAAELRKNFGIRIKRPLVDATMKRIAKGVFKFVINAKEPFIVNLTHQGSDRNEPLTEPFRTFTGAHRGEKAVVVPWVLAQERFDNAPADPLDKPIRTVTASGGRCFGLVAAFLAKHYSGVVGSDVKEPIGTITSVDHHSLVSAFTVGAGGPARAGEPRSTAKPFGTLLTKNDTHLAAAHFTKFYGTNTGHRTDEPLHSITAEGQHIGHVCAFLQKYYGTGGQDQDLRDPVHTVPTVDRFGLVTVSIDDSTYLIYDIAMRMLVARELYQGQGFPKTYIIQIEIEKITKAGKKKRVPLSNEAQVRMCGNSVSPPVAAAIVAANVPELAVWRNGERKKFERQYRAFSRAA